MLQGEMPTTIKGAMEICLGWEGSTPDSPSSMGNCVTALGQFESAQCCLGLGMSFRQREPP